MMIINDHKIKFVSKEGEGLKVSRARLIKEFRAIL